MRRSIVLLCICCMVVRTLPEDCLIGEAEGAVCHDVEAVLTRVEVVDVGTAEVSCVWLILSHSKFGQKDIRSNPQRPPSLPYILLCSSVVK